MLEHMWSYRHQNFTVYQLPALQDNYIYLLAPHNSQLLIAVDPAEAVTIAHFCKTMHRPLTHILNTHHHWDHTDGNLPLKQKFNCMVFGAAHDAHRIPGIGLTVSEQHPPEIGNLNIRLLTLPGHTSGHIGYLIDDALFCGDVLFGAGCGRLFEGTHAQMWQSLGQLAQLNGDTKVYCAHEYTLSNLDFAQSIAPENSALMQRIQLDGEKRQQQQPTIPTTIASEIATNPFLWPLNSEFNNNYATEHSIATDALSVFTDLRQRKDRC